MQMEMQQTLTKHKQLQILLYFSMKRKVKNLESSQEVL